ncbi:MAG: lipoprotein [Hyphomonadaceae bacterium]|nr:lipoprotein [Hyphomonadaceae bacterium]
MKRTALALIGLTLLSGCGIKGGLERPDPLWNREEAMAREQQQQQRDAEIAARRAGQSAPTAQAPAEPSPEPAPAPQ